MAAEDGALGRVALGEINVLERRGAVLAAAVFHNPEDERCEAWAAAGECEGNPSFMLDSCSTACKNAQVTSKIPTTFPPPPPVAASLTRNLMTPSGGVPA